MQPADYQIGIIGSGPVGSLLALGCARSGYRVSVFDSAPLQDNTFVHPQHRTLVLNPSSIQLLTRLGIDVHSLGQQIEKIMLRSYRHPTSVALDSRHHHHDFFGLAIPQPQLQNTINQSICQVEKHSISISNISYDQQGKICCGDDTRTYTHDLLIIADGTFSDSLQLLGITSTRNTPSSHAIVGSIGINHAKGWRHTALEVFDPRHAITCVVVPLPDSEGDATLIILAPRDFATPQPAWIQKRFQGWLEIQSYTHQATWQLWESQSDERIRPRVAVIGNAALTMHPLAAQGLNLAYAQSAVLLDLLTHHSGDPGNWAQLRRFAHLAQKQQGRVAGLVKGLRLCADHPVLLQAGLLSLHAPCARNLLAAVMNTNQWHA